MLASSTPIDLILILTADQYHASQAIQAANAGKHIFIEKPMAQTLAEADKIEEARVKNGVVIFVGYMRRFATALERVKEVMEGEEVKYVRVRDIIGKVSRKRDFILFHHVLRNGSILRVVLVEPLVHYPIRILPQNIHRPPSIRHYRPRIPPITQHHPSPRIRTGGRPHDDRCLGDVGRFGES